VTQRNIELPRADPSVHTVGKNHSGDVGRNQLALLRHSGLRPQSHMLEIGCGVGRLVYELAGFMDDGSYVGFDISPNAIAWLNEHYAPVLPNYQFDLLDVHNSRYHRDGNQLAAQIRWPYDDNRFDFACAFSVFTHMRAPDVANYLGELGRVLASGSTGVITCHAVRPDDPPLMFKGRAPMVSIADGVYTTSAEVPEYAIAFDDALIKQMIGAAGLSIVDYIPARWRRATTGDAPVVGQDTFVLSPA
jgi:SAM-dependent methyltransferase